ncbi:MAG: DUF1015 domain-containing protein [Acidobacteria bacterium]|nr:DUF1015 domain-containing protein [Acidobacteriota bacterium]
MIIHPFRALRYNPERVHLADVVTQPYDKIERQMQAAYYQKSPYNLVRIIKSRETEVRGDEGYAAAGRLWAQWIRDTVLVQESRPAYFIYRQKFLVADKFCVRHALVGLLDLRRSQRVLAHEQTLSGPRGDRLRLIRQTESNEGLVFLLYRDSTSRFRNIAEVAHDRAPLESVTDEFGTEHETFALKPEEAGFVDGVFEDGDLIIADGHHRFSVALQFMQECETKGWKPAAPESFDKRMVAVVEMSDPGLIILPTHRVVFGIPQYLLASWEEKMSARFEKVEAASLPELMEKLNHSGPGSFGTFSLDAQAVWIRKQKPEPEELDVSILHLEILAKTLGITGQQVAAESKIRYFRDPLQAMQEVKRGSGQLAFFLNPTRIEQVEACAKLGRVMPQKSTDFFPKMLSGLLFMKMEIVKS